MTAGVYGELTEDRSTIILAVTGDDWELDRAAAALRRITPLLKPTKPKGMLACPATWAAVTQLGMTFTADSSLGRWLPQPRLRAWIAEEFARRHTPFPLDLPPSGLPLAPDGLVPRAYQLEAAAMIGAQGKFLLFDDPGVGKTVSTLLGLKVRIRALNSHAALFPMLIVAPSWEVGDVWARHIRDWAPEWPEPVMYGGADRTPGDISITTYATMRLDAADERGPLVKLRAKAVIADEVHLAKNPDSKQSQALRRAAFRAQTVVALTGTPVTRDVGDIFPVLAAMDPASWPSRERFAKRYLDVTDDGYGEKVEGLAALAEPEFRTVLAGQHRRVAKGDVLDQLPPKIYSARRIEIPPAWRNAYDTMADDMLAELPDGGELPVMSVLAQLTRLSQLASAACDVAVTREVDEATGEVRKHYEVTLKAPSWKADALANILAERPGQQTAVFANSKQLITIAGRLLQDKGYRCGYLTGGMAKKARQHAIGQFQAGELDVILCTAGAGGLGITLTAASAVVMLQRSWELDKAVQPEDRAHRIGNAHAAVEIIDVIAKDTVDDRVRELMRAKGGQLGQLVRDPRIVKELLGGLK